MVSGMTPEEEQTLTELLERACENLNEEIQKEESSL